MARYYASIHGKGGVVTRTGTPSSGIHGHIRGWRVGVEVDCHPDPKNTKMDVCEVYKTGGSKRNLKREHIATIKERD